jgi:hypothetical protein
MRLRRLVQDPPRPLEWAYWITERLFRLLNPFFARVGYGRVERLLLPLERVSKEMLFDCRMCGQCILRLKGMTCPMTCPKSLRHGPCGGVRPGGYCEVYPERRCVWTDAYQRSLCMPIYGERIRDVQPPVDWRLEGRSAWMNMRTSTEQENL